jgi:uncharacterized protein YbjT (DUF2867 family)
MPQNKTVFVTGASGLLGINVIENLLLHEYNVIGLLRNKNKFPLPKNKQLKIIIGDISNPETYVETLKKRTNRHSCCGSY